jgi:hypothetical protein
MTIKGVNIRPAPGVNLRAALTSLMRYDTTQRPYDNLDVLSERSELLDGGQPGRVSCAARKDRA